MKEKGVDISSGFNSLVKEKSMDEASILGGVPVFILPSRNCNVSCSVLANPIAGLSPMRPAGIRVSPMFIIPLRNVPVVMTTWVSIK